MHGADPRTHSTDRPPVPSRLRGLTVVLPCLDEEANVAAAIERSAAAARACSDEYQIVVVDDGSTDDTLILAADHAAADPRVRLVVHAHNRGYGHALRSGIESARMEWVLLMDADLQYDPGELVDFVAPAAEAEAIWGRRILRSDAARRRFAAAVWNRLVRALFDLPVDDVDCGFKLIHGDLLRSLPLESGGTLVSTELAVRCRAAGACFAQVGVHHHPRTGGSQKAGTIAALRELARRRRALQQVARSSG
ncbi:MAG TPA: glycosyltransferase family 2 protein [Solirubrobacteraceae bacterium]|nr:glycosyltransferase family 2 protein [Solirubrobacteraceae bacterium]